MATRYQLGDVLLPEAESLATALPRIIADAKANQLYERKLNQDSRRIELAEERAEEDRKFRNQQAGIAQQNVIQQQEFQRQQAEERTMNSMLRAANTPSQRAMIYNKYGKYDMAAAVKAEGDKVEDQNTIVENYWSESLGSSPKDVVRAGKSALSNIDLTHSNYSSIAERTHKAYQESLNPYRDMMNDPEYQYESKLLLAAGKMPNADIKGIFDQFDSMKERYIKGKYGEVEGEVEGDDGKALSIDEQADQLVSSILEGDAFKPEDALDLGPQTEADVRQVATQIETSSEVNIGKLQSSLPKLENRKDILDRTSRLRGLTDVQAKELEQINAAIKATKAEIKKQKRSLGQAKRETELFRGISYSPLRG
tara:strand:- start:11405 stop:12508 length:1104 start_codon:yes stop_codon:yes gene_type:complete